MSALPPELAENLAGRRFALLGFADDEAKRISAVLEDGQAFVRTLDPSAAAPGAPALRAFDMLVLSATPAAAQCSPWLQPEQLANSTKPLLLIGPANALGQHLLLARNPALDFLLVPWQPEEFLLRAARTLAAAGAARNPGEEATKQAVATVAVADDDATTVALVKATIERHGFKCLAATDGATMMETIRRTLPSAVIVDGNMPNMDGFEVLAAMRGDPRLKSIPVLMLTALNDEADVMRGFGLGADDYVVKPFNPMELVARLTRLLRRQ
ncbi:MAG: response regulator [Planctomycetota bacterium]